MPRKSPPAAQDATKATKPKAGPTPKTRKPAAKKAPAKTPTQKKPAAAKSAAWRAAPSKAVEAQPQAAAVPEATGAGGRPTSFRPEYIAQAQRLAALGATDIEVADFFEVCVATLFNWRASIPEFLEATRLGKEAADDRVEQRLYARAMGYEHNEVDIRVVNGQVVQTPIRKFYPPDTAAASFWLRNRRPNLWRDKVEAVHTGPDGGPIQARIAVEFVKPVPRAEGEDE